MLAKTKMSIFIILAAFCCLYVCCVLKCSQRTLTLQNKASPLDSVIQRLALKVNSYQVLDETDYNSSFSWYKARGLFRSEIRFNFFGGPALKLLRNDRFTYIQDNNMFATACIVTALLEAELYGSGAPVFDKTRLQLALNAIDSFKDKNQPSWSNGSLVQTFWPQVFNKSVNTWQQRPENLENLANRVIKRVEELEDLLKILNLDNLVWIAEMVKKLINMCLEVLGIPADFNDSFVNLGIGGALSQLQAVYPDQYRKWRTLNSDMAGLADLTLKYAYRPFDSDSSKNMIDPRSYFYARTFILKAAKKNRTVSLITTWVQNINEQRQLQPKCVSMPFNLNNVDLAVIANSLYGITSAALFNLNNFSHVFLGSSDLIATYLNSTKFICSIIQTNFTSRPDLATMYYPSRYNFLWYASRILFLIENQYKNLNSTNSNFLVLTKLKRIFMEARVSLDEVFENEMSVFLFENHIKVDTTRTFFVDFLGQADRNRKRQPSPSFDDALFSTAQSINILIATWTHQNPKTRRLEWKKHAPFKAKELIKSSVQWLAENVLGRKYKPMNAFFSGSDKGRGETPFSYPSNFMQFLNGTNVTNPDDVSGNDFQHLINGVQGFIDEKTYQKMLAQPHFGDQTPLDFKGYNSGMDFFPFWSSEAYTYAVSLLALAQFNNLE